MTQRKPIPGKHLHLPPECEYVSCGEITRNILVTGCLEAHIEEHYVCGRHTDVYTQLINRGSAPCLSGDNPGGHCVKLYETRVVRWEPGDFPGKWVLTCDGEIVAAAQDPAVISKKTLLTPGATMIWIPK